MEKGYIQVYTGNGKQKITAALGLALRAAGSGLRVYIAKFMEKGHCSEIRALERLSDRIAVEQFGTGCSVRGKPDPADFEAARKGLAAARQAMLSGGYDMVVLEEANVAYESKIISEQDLMDFVSAKPDGVELVLTGRGGAPAVLERADLITEIKLVRHYFEQGVGTRTGIES
ncbi:MAG: cob(I)yrinic acid a,c-diamide adenosyltransferase [Desulfosalsimonas sp.]|uniref:cob(I)yrinic acid a,c-diamide adenosyltransferase n=1 Tax=Desulfosalsimonas sp. TaxID=3073848 RepID=UPI00397109B9